MIKQINSEEEFKTEVLNNGKMCIVDFFATWCEPCKMLSPVVEAVSEMKEFGNTVNFYKVDIDGLESLAMKYQVEVVPTLVFFKNGKAVKVEVGYKSEEELAEVVRKEI